MDYSNRRYVIFNVSELDKINFAEVLETSAETVRKSVDETKTFVKWDSINRFVEAETGEEIIEEFIPDSIKSLTTKSKYYTHEEILDILSEQEWTVPVEI
jgi:DNA primase